MTLLPPGGYVVSVGLTKLDIVKKEEKRTNDLSNQGQGPSGSSMDGVVRGPDHHSGRQRRDAFDRPGGRSGCVAWVAKEGARLRPTTHLSHARPYRPDRRARFQNR